MSIRKLLAASRQSGPATVYELDAAGIITKVTVRPARPAEKMGRLKPEERLHLLMENGEWPDDLPAEAWVGVQANDNHGYDRNALVADLRATGIMSGFADPTCAQGRSEHPSSQGSLGQHLTSV